MKKIIIGLIIITLLTIGISFSINMSNGTKNIKDKKKTLEAQVIYIEDKQIILQDNNNIIYTIQNNLNVDIGDKLIIEYDKNLNKNKEFQEIDILNYQILEKNTNYNKLQNKGIFSEYHNKALITLEELSIDEKIAQLFLVRVPVDNQETILERYQFGGYLFFERDFKDKTKEEVIKMIDKFQKVSKIPLLTAIDEEGGKVSRLSSNKNIISTPFKSSQELYQEGGFNLIKEDTINKSTILKELGLNLNLAPVVDISENEDDYIYPRTLGENYLLTSKYAETVINASKETGVSYTLKHFPGYGNNSDTHLDTSVDDRDYSTFLNKDLLPFEKGIKAGCEAIMISHNVVTAIDENNPASLSVSIHNLLKNQLKFTGIIITDDLHMGAVSKIKNNTLKALLAGNDLIITTDYEKSINEIKQALNNGIISEDLINKSALKIIAWKYYKNLL